MNGVEDVDTTNGQSWQSDERDFTEVTLPRLKELGKKIGDDATDGNKWAKKIVKYYGMLYRRFDPMFHHLLKEAIKEYENGNHARTAGLGKVDSGEENL